MVPLRSLGRTITALSYEGTSAVLIRRLKFEGRRDGRALLLEHLRARIEGLRFDAIVPVPRHWRRIREQGCDPVHDLARGLARVTGVPLRVGFLLRTRSTPPQTELRGAERRRSAAGTFGARKGALRGRSVLLLDDVTTTGATLRAAAGALRRDAGARRVVRVAVAGTPPDPGALSAG